MFAWNWKWTTLPNLHFIGSLQNICSNKLGLFKSEQSYEEDMQFGFNKFVHLRELIMRYARSVEHARMLVSHLISYTRTMETICLYKALGDFIRVESSSS
jgi:hypothetical protein